jgi:PPOX class probable F420-dependent enzyme
VPLNVTTTRYGRLVLHCCAQADVRTLVPRCRAAAFPHRANGDNVGFPEQTSTEEPMSIAVARFLDVANGLQPKQFTVGAHDEIRSLADLDPIYKRLLDEPVTAVVAVIGKDGRPNLTPMWFDYEGSTVFVNVATHRKKVEWIRRDPRLTLLLMNPANPYHWLSIKCRVKREVLEDDPKEGARVTAQLDKIWTKYTKQPPPYGLRDPSINERRVLFECEVEKIATFGKP